MAPPMVAATLIKICPLPPIWCIISKGLGDIIIQSIISTPMTPNFLKTNTILTLLTKLVRLLSTSVAIIFAIFGAGATPYLIYFYYGLFHNPEQYYIKQITFRDVVCRTGNHIQFGMLAPIVPLLGYFLFGLLIMALSFFDRQLTKKIWRYVAVLGFIISLWLLFACILANREFYCSYPMKGM